MQMQYDCKTIANEIIERVKNNGLCQPINLHVIANTTEAGSSYVKNKLAIAHECGFITHIHSYGELAATDTIAARMGLDSDMTNVVLRDIIHSYIKAPTIIQLPFHSKVDNQLDQYLSPKCDADGLTSGAIVQPATAKGVYTFLEKNNLIDGKRIVIIGRSQLVGKPLAKMLIGTDATVTLCHSKTQSLHELCKIADVIVVAVGKPNFITKSMIDQSKNVVIVDVGINRDKDGKLCGDVSKDVIGDNVYVTPVPGGVGLLTTACLMDNVIRLYNEYSDYFKRTDTYND